MCIAAAVPHIGVTSLGGGRGLLSSSVSETDQAGPPGSTAGVRETRSAGLLASGGVGGHRQQELRQSNVRGAPGLGGSPRGVCGHRRGLPRILGWRCRRWGSDSPELKVSAGGGQGQWVKCSKLSWRVTAAQLCEYTSTDFS